MSGLGVDQLARDGGRPQTHFQRGLEPAALREPGLRRALIVLIPGGCGCRLHAGVGRQARGDQARAHVERPRRHGVLRPDAQVGAAEAPREQVPSREIDQHGGAASCRPAAASSAAAKSRRGVPTGAKRTASSSPKSLTMKAAQTPPASSSTSSRSKVISSDPDRAGKRSADVTPKVATLGGLPEPR
jgi:hypothetical protein